MRNLWVCRVIESTPANPLHIHQHVHFIRNKNGKQKVEAV